MTIELVCVDPKTVHQIWPLVRPLIWEAMRRGNLSAFVFVESSVLSEVGLLWLVIDSSKGKILAATVTELLTTEWQKICIIVACAGLGMKEWLPLISGIEKYARAEGCEAVRIMGRKGWARMLKDYKETRVILEKVL